MIKTQINIVSLAPFKPITIGACIGRKVTYLPSVTLRSVYPVKQTIIDTQIGDFIKRHFIWPYDGRYLSDFWFHDKFSDEHIRLY